MQELTGTMLDLCVVPVPEPPRGWWQRQLDKLPKLGIPKSWYGQFLLMFVTEFFSYFLIVANTRAYTQANYFWTAVTDFVFAGQGFILWRLMVDNKEARSWWAGLGYTVGGTAGSLVSIWCTVHLYGK